MKMVVAIKVACCAILGNVFRECLYGGSFLRKLWGFSTAFNFTEQRALLRLFFVES